MDSHGGGLITVTGPCPGGLDTETRFVTQSGRIVGWLVTGSWLAVRGIGMKIMTLVKSEKGSYDIVGWKGLLGCYRSSITVVSQSWTAMGNQDVMGLVEQKFQQNGYFGLVNPLFCRYWYWQVFYSMISLQLVLIILVNYPFLTLMGGHTLRQSFFFVFK